jgi:hypothetical protein
VHWQIQNRREHPAHSCCSSVARSGRRGVVRMLHVEGRCCVQSLGVHHSIGDVVRAMDAIQAKHWWYLRFEIALIDAVDSARAVHAATMP